jgi:CpcD/allophycocyanin linker domain
MTGMFTGDRMVRLEITGIRQSSISRTHRHTMTVPYSSLSTTIQNLSKTGGKIVGVQVSDVKAQAAQAIPSAPAPIDKTPTQSKKGRKK